MGPLILASASPRRADLLRAAGFEFVVVPAAIDESPAAGERPDDYVRRLAVAKAAAVTGTPRGSSPGATKGGHAARGAANEGSIVLGADTAVVLDGQLLGKPASDVEATAMLERLSGRTHEVLTGVALRREGRTAVEVDRTLVTFASLDPDEIVWYVASGEPRDKAGAYGIQGLASRFVERIDGSYANVVGLPVHIVRRMLREIVPDE